MVAATWQKSIFAPHPGLPRVALAQRSDQLTAAGQWDARMAAKLATGPGSRGSVAQPSANLPSIFTVRAQWRAAMRMQENGNLGGEGSMTYRNVMYQHRLCWQERIITEVLTACGEAESRAESKQLDDNKS